jgi:sRNA-binding protein
LTAKPWCSGPTACHGSTNCADGRRHKPRFSTAGGARVDLDGNIAGQVSTEQRSHAERMVARIEACHLADAAAAKAEAERKEAARQAAAPPSMFGGRVAIMPAAETTPPTGGGRLGAAGLKRAAQERQARQQAKHG